MSDNMRKGAIISECGQFRYALARIWDQDKPVAVFVMLNPSTADAEQDDPTIRKCIGFAKRWGMGAILVANLYAYRATSPTDLKKAGWPVGPSNDDFIEQAARVAARAGRLVCAWGANAYGRQRPTTVLAKIREHARPMALELTKDGIPKHPLYVPYERAPFELSSAFPSEKP